MDGWIDRRRSLLPGGRTDDGVHALMEVDARKEKNDRGSRTGRQLRAFNWQFMSRLMRSFVHAHIYIYAINNVIDQPMRPVSGQCITTGINRFAECFRHSAKP
jgi:tRNA U38,U39,U40 pseudouridine synthase TruA